MAALQVTPVHDRFRLGDDGAPFEAVARGTGQSMVIDTVVPRAARSRSR